MYLEEERNPTLIEPPGPKLSSRHLTDSSGENGTASSTSSESNSIVQQGLVRASSGSERRLKRPRKSNSGLNVSPASINYKGINIYQAAEQGNMPLCVLLWSIASAKRANLTIPDINGNTPLHFAALADTAEVSSFISYALSHNLIQFHVFIR
jgi:hypothetical protein